LKSELKVLKGVFGTLGTTSGRRSQLLNGPKRESKKFSVASCSPSLEESSRSLKLTILRAKLQ